MFFGVDTAFFIFALVTSAESALVMRGQQEDQPNYAPLEQAWSSLTERGVRPSDIETLAIVDFTKPSYLHRLYIYNRGQCRPSSFFCAHGRNSGDIFPFSFSNQSGSYQTSLGLFQMGSQYLGQWGKSLKMHGLDEGTNDRALARAIVLHSAWYSNPDIVTQNILEGYGPRIGRSQGCPAVPKNDLQEVVSQLKPGTYLYIHGPAIHR